MPSNAVLCFSDPDEHHAAIRAGEARALVTAAGNYKGEQTRIDLHRVWMQRGQTSLPTIVHTAVSKSRVGFFFLADANQAPIRHTGMNLAPKEMMCYSAGAEMYRCAPAAYRWSTMSLAPDDLAATGQAMLRHEIRAPSVNYLIRPAMPAMSRLLQLHDAADHLARTASDVLAHTEVARAMEQALLTALMACVADSTRTRQNSFRELRIPVMRRFERVLKESQGRPVYLPELCAKMNVSHRTLRLRCMEEVGMSPHEFLRRRRMSLVHRALLRASAKDTTVTAIANDFGFGELGHFAVGYRKLFGEMPSMTLKRVPGQPANDSRTTSEPLPLPFSRSHP